MYDLILYSGRLVDPFYGEVSADIGVKHGIIAGVGDLSGEAAVERLNMKGCHIFPGFIDTHVHFRDPGNTKTEDMYTGTLSALLGGMTGVCDMPNTDPATIKACHVRDKVKQARGRSWVDYGFFLGAHKDNIDTVAYDVREPGCVGLKIFMGCSTGGLCIDDPAYWQSIRRLNVPMCVHAEDQGTLDADEKIWSSPNVHVHPYKRSKEAAVKAMARLYGMAVSMSRPLHVLHVSSCGEIDLLKKAGAFLTCELTPHHALLSAPSCYRRFRSFAQVNPPIRVPLHARRLLRGLKEDLFYTLGSDHAPHAMRLKQRRYPETPSGMPGVQTMLPLFLSLFKHMRLPWKKLARLLSYNPAALIGVSHRRGRLLPGYEGTFTCVDTAASSVIEGCLLASKSKWTCFEGVQVHGWPVAVILRGKIIMQDGHVNNMPMGEPILTRHVRLV